MYLATRINSENRDEKPLEGFERTVLRSVFKNVRLNDEYQRRRNRELYELYGKMDIVKGIKI